MSGGSNYDAPGVYVVTNNFVDDAHDDYNRSVAIYVMTSFFNTKDIGNYLLDKVVAVLGSADFPAGYYQIVDSQKDASLRHAQEIQVDSNALNVHISLVDTSSFLVALIQDLSLCTTIRHIAETYHNKENGTALKDAATKALQVLVQQINTELTAGIDAF